MQTCSHPTQRPDASAVHSFDTVERVVTAVASGQFVVVVDAQSRENEGDLIIAADAVTPEAVEFMRRHTSGVICVALPSEVCDKLELPPMVQRNCDAFTTAFTVSVDKREGVTTGISASDRAATLRALSDPGAVAANFVRPGHIFPLRSRAGGVLVRPGHTEAADDLVRMAGCGPGGVLSEIVNPDGEMARRPELLRFARMHGLVAITIEQLIEYRRSQ